MMRAVTIGNGTRKIGKNAFSRCASIGTYVFAECIDLANIKYARFEVQRYWNVYRNERWDRYAGEFTFSIAEESILQRRQKHLRYRTAGACFFKTNMKYFRRELTL